MELTYLDYLFLDLFSTEEARKVNSLFHILTGKRTVSVLMQAMRMDLEAYFSLFPKLQPTIFEEKINQFIRSDLLTFELFLTEEGKAAKDNYFDSHTRPTKNRIKYHAVLAPFKARSLFLTQVLSERIHNNKNYLPLQPRLSEQWWLKKYLKEHNLNTNENCQKLGQEWMDLIVNAKISKPEMFVEQFEGYHKTKLTNNQIGSKYNLDETGVYVQLQQDWIQLIETIEMSNSGYPLLASLLKELTRDGGLCSESAKETYQLWKAGFAIEQIAEKRFLKRSTINDHLTEMAILYEAFPFERFLDASQIDYVNNQVTAGKAIDYNDVQEKFPGIPFFQSRLMQVKGETSHERK
ncbi:helix-turn-helix domain-containing protein [Jeotgalibaca sp. A127]|uniref:helix-turn-helix domain-containing protein n=1 Tax=Jeotgalibaca sp. A127 TaxID=3457324 RepID=UPI003FD3B3EE